MPMNDPMAYFRPLVMDENVMARQRMAEGPMLDSDIYTSVFAPRADMSGPVGPGGQGFGPGTLDRNAIDPNAVMPGAPAGAGIPDELRALLARRLMGG